MGYNPNKLVSDCCGATPGDEFSAQVNGNGVCSQCKEDCLFITQEEFDESVCEFCDGKGETEKTFGGYEGEPEYDAPVTCIFCDGTGRINIKQ